MTFYASAATILDILMLAMVVHVIHYSGFTKEQKTWFNLTFLATTVCSTAEFCVHCGFYKETWALPLTIITVIQFSIAPLIGVFFSGALGLRERAKKALLFFAVNPALQILLAPMKEIFYFDAQGYHRGELFLIYEFFYFVALIYLGLSMLEAGKNFSHRDRPTIIMVMVLLISGVVPVTFFNIHTAYLAIGLSACLCYIYYNDLVQEDTKKDLIKNQEKIDLMQRSTVTGLANLIESRDTETGEHVSRTQRYARALAIKTKQSGLYKEVDDAFIDSMTRFAPLHDVGKIVVSDNILRKQGKLTPEEYEAMKQHTVVADKIMHEVFGEFSDESLIKFASDIAAYHHEWWNGSGYPKGLKAEEIPLSARIMALADVYDALISKRCYKEAFSKQKSMEIIKNEAGTHFDPGLTKLFLEILDEEK